MDVKNGKYFTGDSFTKEIFDIVADYSNQLHEAYLKSDLPDKPDRYEIQKVANEMFYIQTTC
jgi:hypothetical protein